MLLSGFPHRRLHFLAHTFKTWYFVAITISIRMLFMLKYIFQRLYNAIRSLLFIYLNNLLTQFIFFATHVRS